MYKREAWQSKSLSEGFGTLLLKKPNPLATCFNAPLLFSALLNAQQPQQYLQFSGMSSFDGVSRFPILLQHSTARQGTSIDTEAFAFQCVEAV